MSGWPVHRDERTLVIAGLAGSAIALCLALLDAPAALTGWLSAAAFVLSVPLGAIVFLLMMRLMRGKWEDDLRPPAAIMVAAVPLAALAMVPPIIGMAAVYPWLGAPPQSEFARFWLNPVFFVVRSAAWFAFLWFVARRVAEPMGEVLAAGLLIVIVLGANFIAADWLMTLDPQFASSGFGLQVLAIQLCAGLGIMILFRLALGEPAHPNVLGGLLLTLLLLWAYFQFMPFLIVWSGNLPDGVAWYIARSGAGWKVTLLIAGLLGGVPLFALFSPQVRSSAQGLRLCSISVVAGKAIELGWIALPGRGALAIVAACLALAALAALVLALLLRIGRERRLAA